MAIYVSNESKIMLNWEPWLPTLFSTAHDDDTESNILRNKPVFCSKQTGAIGQASFA